MLEVAELRELIEGGAVAFLGAAFLLTLRWMMTRLEVSLGRLERLIERVLEKLDQ